jgi:16S rRNA (guanine966-N2)-methyltransferase
MRIISGIHKGRVLKVPSSKFTRPTTDKTKGVIFNYLNNLVDFTDISVCDIYAGSGSLGLEAFSRGAGSIHFIEKNFPVMKILKQNIDLLKCEQHCRIFKMEAVKFSKLTEHEQYDLILADPPFFKNDIHEVVENLLSGEFLTSGGILLVERSVQTEKEDVTAFSKEPFKKSGDSLLYQFIKD